jgi:ribosomal protein S16
VTREILFLLVTCHLSPVTGGKRFVSNQINENGLSKRDGAYLESIGTYNPIGKEGEIRLDAERAQYWIERGAQPTETVRRLIKANAKAQAAQTETV